MGRWNWRGGGGGPRMKGREGEECMGGMGRGEEGRMEEEEEEEEEEIAAAGVPIGAVKYRVPQEAT